MSSYSTRVDDHRQPSTAFLADRTREPRQRRSTERRDGIVQAAITVIGRDGIARLTHRSVAAEARVPLAATTYYYATRDEIIAAASAELLRTYICDYTRLAERLATGSSLTLDQVALRIITGAAGKHRVTTLAWCEIMLSCAKDAGGQAVARDWFDAMRTIWTRIAAVTGSLDPAGDALSVIETVTGLLLIVLAMGLDGKQVAAVLRSDGIAPASWASSLGDMSLPGSEVRAQKRGDVARARIVSAAADLVIGPSLGGLTMRKVARRAGVSPAAPSYYFASARDLMNATLWRLFDDAKTRYRGATSALNAHPADPDQLADLTVAIFIREATEYRAVALASQPLQLEAARQPDLRAAVWGSIEDQSRAWARQLSSSGIAAGECHGLILQSLFLGKLIRSLVTKAATAELASVRAEFLRELRAVQSGTHWAKNWYDRSKS